MNKFQFQFLLTEIKLRSRQRDLLKIMVQDPKIGMKYELNHGIETEEQEDRIED